MHALAISTGYTRHSRRFVNSEDSRFRLAAPLSAHRQPTDSSTSGV